VTDRPGSSADESPDITDVRRLLADSRHTQPMPDDVAARMDRVLAGLSNAPAAGPREPGGTRDAQVVTLAGHRRRRTAGLLVAAAAIVVGGVAVAQNLPSRGTSGASTTSAAEDRAQTEGGMGFDQGGPDASPSPRVPSANGSDNDLLHHGRVLVRPRHFAEDALQGRRLLGLDLARAQSFEQACADLAARAHAVPAEYRHAPAALVFRRPGDDSQVVDLFVCGTPQPVRSTRLPAP
jgi:hypothetical protein